ncbi:MAG: Smr/MutS family protein [Gallionella sp.]
MKRNSVKPPETDHPDDLALFHESVGKIHRLPEQHRISPQFQPRRPVIRDTVASTVVIADSLSDHAADAAAAEFLRNGVSRMNLRKLRRGQWPVQRVLDLHGSRRDAARQLLVDFLHDTALNDMRCILVVHGKGMNSPGGESVLRNLTRNWLAQHPQVLAYCDATPRLGGSGALLVLLKSKVV